MNPEQLFSLALGLVPPWMVKLPRFFRSQIENTRNKLGHWDFYVRSLYVTGLVVAGRTVSIKARSPDFETVTRAHIEAQTIWRTEAISAFLPGLLAKAIPAGLPVHTSRPIVGSDREQPGQCRGNSAGKWSDKPAEGDRSPPSWRR
jgi:hypothetical protein